MPPDRPAWVLTVDNDYFNLWQSEYHRPDAEYTHGAAVSISLPATGGPFELLLPTRQPCRRLPRCFRWRAGLRQEIYTPPLTAPPMRPGTRPYAGWLAAHVGLERELEARKDHLLLIVGVTGEPSLAGALQRGIHDLLGNPDPSGWAHQLPFEPGVLLEYETARYLLQVADAESSGLHVAGVGLVRLGTVQTGGTVGARLTAGYRAGRPWEGSVWRPLGRFSWYLVAGTRLDAVLRNEFLQGTLFQESAGVGIRPLVLQLELGIAARYGRLRVEWAAVHRGREYLTQEKPHTYSRITLNLLP